MSTVILNDNQCEVLKLRHKGLTYKAIGAIIGLSGNRCREIKLAAERKIAAQRSRDYLQGYQLEQFKEGLFHSVGKHDTRSYYKQLNLIKLVEGKSSEWKRRNCSTVFKMWCESHDWIDVYDALSHVLSVMVDVEIDTEDPVDQMLMEAVARTQDYGIKKVALMLGVNPQGLIELVSQSTIEECATPMSWEVFHATVEDFTDEDVQ